MDYVKKSCVVVCALLIILTPLFNKYYLFDDRVMSSNSPLYFIASVACSVIGLLVIVYTVSRQK